MLGVLRNRTYARLFSAQVIALIGTGLLTVALGLLAFDIAGGDAGAVLGVAMAIKMIAYVAIAPIISALFVRLPRKPVLIGADLVRAGIAVMLPFVTDAWQIYILIFVLQSASATFTPTFQALIPSVLPDERDYTRALSLSRLAYDLESLLSPMLAAALLLFISYHNLFLGTVLGFLISASLVSTAVLGPVGPVDTTAGFTERLTRGIRAFRCVPELRGLMGLNLVVAMATSMVIVNTVEIVRAQLGGGQAEVALLLGAYGAGSMVVALGLPRVLDGVPDRRVMLTGGAVVPVALLAVPAALTLAQGRMQWVILTVLWILLGAATSMVLTPSARLLRRNSDQDSRPAVFAAQFSLSHLCFLLGYPLAGTFGAVVGLPAIAVLLSVIAGTGVIVTAREWRVPAPVATPSPTDSA
ncbi:MFS transporter [Corynebacterium pacaense]|uniref:MFS transporter n=1 Tax=Corynebacterium pacaense TaxID=1816684 RepID=UPI0009BACDA0|nr:MFS transporter [Corynebacterium pacaense]